MKVSRGYTIDVELLSDVKLYAEKNDQNLSETAQEMIVLGYEDHKKTGRWLRR